MAITNQTTDFLPVVSVQDACCVLGIKRTKLFALIRDAELPIVKVGTRTLVLRTGILEFLERNTLRGGR